MPLRLPLDKLLELRRRRDLDAERGARRRVRQLELDRAEEEALARLLARPRAVGGPVLGVAEDRAAERLGAVAAELVRPPLSLIHI